MRKVSGGYTIIELIIVLAISTIILGAAILAIHGTSARTGFAQSMRDVNSSMQDWMNDVTDGFTGGSPAAYTCKLVSGRPTLIASAGNNGAECVFLGKAIQITDDGCGGNCIPNQSSKIYVYSIFGQRIDAQGTLIDDLSTAAPSPAVGDIPAGIQTGQDLTRTYDILNGASVQKVTINGTTTSGGLIGFFNSFNGTAATSGNKANGSQSLNAYFYPSATNSGPANTTAGDAIAQCLEMNPACVGAGVNPPPLNSAQICFTSNTNNELAVLTITSNNGLGAQTKLDFVTTCP